MANELPTEVEYISFHHSDKRKILQKPSPTNHNLAASYKFSFSVFIKVKVNVTSITFMDKETKMFKKLSFLQGHSDNYQCSTQSLKKIVNVLSKEQDNEI